MSAGARGGGQWTRGYGVSLVHARFSALADDAGVRRALLDGIERGLNDRPIDPPSRGADTYEVRAVGRRRGVLVAKVNGSRRAEVVVSALAITPEHRGHAFGARALLAAERRWLRDGAHRILVRVPATNGRGLYFLLRCGFTPLPRQDEPDATWFARKALRR